MSIFYHTCFIESVSLWFQLSTAFEEFILHFQETIGLFLDHITDEKIAAIEKFVMNANRFDDPIAIKGTLLLRGIGSYKNQADSLALLHNDLSQICIGTGSLYNKYVNVLLIYTQKLSPRQLSISANIFGNSTEQYLRAIALRCLLKNYFTSDSNEMGDQQIVNECLNLVEELYVKSKTDKELLLYNV